MSERTLKRIREAKRKKVKSLNIYGFHSEKLPEEISELIWLKKLNVSNNQLTDISPLSNLINLSELDLGNNHLTDISPLSNLVKLSKLSLNDNQLTDISPLSNLINLSELDLQINQLTDISPLSNLVNLSKIEFFLNQLTDISPLSGLNNLSKLGLERNQLTDLSPLINLINLSDLNLIDNQLTNISTLSNLVNLSKLHLTYNQVTDVSPLSNLMNLSRLSLDHNQLVDISPLKDLIQKIGIFLEWEDNTISVGDNPLKIPPPEIIKQGTEAVLQYLDSIEEVSSKFYEAKLLILGEGGVGKTTLYRKLQDVNAEMPEEEDTTKGIEIHQLPFKMQNGEDFTINLWDFGGQEIYHATHQFFLSKRSLYVLVTDPRKEDTDFNYWLQIIELLGGDSPVIIVQNEKGGRKKQLDINSIQARFGNIKEVVSLDMKHDIKGIEKLYETIQYHIQRLPHIGEIQPQSWINVRRKLEELSTDSPFIDVESYYQICRENEIQERSEMLILSQYLHDLGVLLHFQDDAILRRRLILQKEWATDAVYAVLDDAKVIDNQGKFTREDVEQIWGLRYEGNDEELLRLMMKFELCYQVPDVQPEKYIATQLLQVGKPDYAWEEKHNLRLEYRYAFMPKGLTSRFIVRMQRYIKDESKMWRTGVVLERKDTRAEIVEAYGTNTIKIRVEGQHQKEFITIITEELDRLNDTFGGELRVDKLVPCNCHICGDSDEPYFYVYKKLIRRKERAKRTVECDISYDDVNVLSLLDELFVSGGMQAAQKKLFISYSQKDEDYLEAFKNHLSPLIRNNDLITWDDKNVIPGEEWDERVVRELDEADIIVFLVSADFLATDYIVDKEVETAIQRHERKETRVIPVIIRDCMWKEMEFSKLSALPQKGKPIQSFDDKETDTAWREVVEEIKSVL